MFAIFSKKMANSSHLILSLILIQGIESKAPNHITFNVDKSYSFRPNYEQLDHTNSASTFDRLLQVLSEAIRRIFPGKKFFVINYGTHSVWFYKDSVKLQFMVVLNKNECEICSKVIVS